MNWTAWLAACTVQCGRWETHVAAAQRVYESFETSVPTVRHGYDAHEPVWNCRTKERFPALPGDGPKFVCGFAVYDAAPRPPAVLSLGSNGDTKFEDALHARFPGASIVTVDPTLSTENLAKVRRKRHIHLVTRAVGDGRDVTIKGRHYTTTSLPQLFDEHGRATILKVDIEGHEHSMLERTRCSDLAGVDQVLIEVHGTPARRALFEWFSSCNMLMFSKEPNVWGCKGVSCSEFSFLTPTFAYREYAMSR